MVPVCGRLFLKFRLWRQQGTGNLPINPTFREVDAIYQAPASALNRSDPGMSTNHKENDAAVPIEVRYVIGQTLFLIYPEKDGVAMVRCLLLAALCLSSPLTCASQNINGEATYISFSVPGAQGTFPLAINASGTVTGYYYASPSQARGFSRTADGTISTFDVMGGVLTQPESINAKGDIAGFYALISEGAHQVTQGFLRYANGRIVTIGPPGQTRTPSVTEPVSINDFDEIAGDYVSDGSSSFTWSAPAGYQVPIQLSQAEATATAINASGSVVGSMIAATGTEGFVLHPDGYFAVITLPTTTLANGNVCHPEVYAESINNAGTIVGSYYGCYPISEYVGGFVMSPDGAITLFHPPGTILEQILYPGSGSLHLLSINQAGDIAGTYIDTSAVRHGFVSNPYGTITSFDPPEGNQTTATAINDLGEVTGYYQYSKGGGPAVGFIRVPQP